MNESHDHKPEGSTPLPESAPNKGLETSSQNEQSFFKRVSHTPKFFKPRDKVIVIVALVVAIVSGVYAGVSSYRDATIEIAEAGGNYTEGIVGEPKFINPLYDQTTDADQDITSLVFSGLMRLNGDYEVEPDLAEDVNLSEDKKVYTVKLRQNVTWHDGTPFTASDVIFTVTAIQNQDYASPLRSSLKGVDVEKVDDHTVTFTLRDSFAPFLTNLTFGILPAHIWENIPPQNATVVDENRKPVGTGPYKFLELKKEKDTGKIISFTMERNDSYYGNAPFIDSITFEFFDTPDELITAFNNKQIDGINFVDVENAKKITRDDITLHEFRLPVYTGLFLNPELNALINNVNFRRALVHSINKDELVEKVLEGHGISVDTALLPGFLGFKKDVDIFDYDPERAKRILEEEGFKEKDDGYYYKGDERLNVKLETTDWPQNVATADALKEYFKAIGVELEVRTFTVSEIQQTFIRPRKYEALLFSQNLGLDPDLYPFWHSSQAFDPGLNLSFIKDDELDDAVEKARSSHDEDRRIEKLGLAQSIIANRVGAIFLFSPNYIYPTTDKLQGIDFENISVPSDRLLGIEQYYLNTKRVFETSEEQPAESSSENASEEAASEEDSEQ